MLIALAAFIALPPIGGVVEIEHRLLPLRGEPDLVERGNPFDYRVETWTAAPVPDVFVPPLEILVTDDDPERLFQQNPPAAPDWLVILNRLAATHPRQITVAPVLSWQEADALELGALEFGLKKIPRTVLAYDLRREATPQELPAYLRPSGIPLTRAKGDFSRIPLVNRVPFPPSATGPSVTLHGFRLLENSPPETTAETVFTPLLARWDDVFLPSLELAHLMAASGTKPSEVTVLPGGYLRLGETGPVIPIDLFGRLAVPVSTLPASRPATDLLAENGPGFAPDSEILMVSKSDPPHLVSTLAALPELASRLPRNHHAYRRPPLGGEVATVLALALFLLPLRAKLLRLALFLPLLYLLPRIFAHQDLILLQVPLAVSGLTLSVLPSRRPLLKKAKKAAKKTVAKKAFSQKPPPARKSAKRKKPAANADCRPPDIPFMSASTATDKAAVLIEALPYLQRFRGQTFVIKMGGSAMEDPALVKEVMRDIVFLEVAGINPIIVHGGGKAISAAMKEAGLPAEFIGGLRVTTPEAIAIVEKTLDEVVNASLVKMLGGLGGKVAPVRGTSVFKAKKIPGTGPGGEPVDLGRVGRVVTCETTQLKQLLNIGVVPVVSPLGAEISTGRPMNINADLAAAALACELVPAKLVYLSDVPGLLRDPSDPGTLIESVTSAQAKKLIADGTITGGMIPKINSALEALAAGVQKVHFIDGRRPHSLLLEIFTLTGTGTEIR